MANEPPEHPAAIPYATPTPGRPRMRVVAALVGLGLLLGAGALALLLKRYTMTVQLRAVTVAATAPTTPAGRAAWVPPPPAPLTPPPPPELDLPARPVRMTITQRKSQAIPGSYGSVLVRIGDITGRQVRLDVETADGQTLAGGTMREGDSVDFAVNGEAYVVVAAEFVNAVIHDDRGVFVVRRPDDAPDEAETIGRLINAIDKSGAVVIAPPEAAQPPEVFFGTMDDAGNPRPAGEYLRDVWWFARRKIRTPADLTRAAARHPAAVGARSSSTDPVPLRLRFPAGRELPAGEWLDAELGRFRQRAVASRRESSRGKINQEVGGSRSGRRVDDHQCLGSVLVPDAGHI